MILKKKENLILRKDYECYKFQLPWKVILKGKENKYIYSQLEKNHPGFSDEWCYEKKAHLNKRGIESDVVVMNRFKLAEYKQRFPGKQLWLEDGRRFSSNKQIISCLILVTAALFATAIFSVNMHAFSKKNHLIKNEVEIEESRKKRTEAVVTLLDFASKNKGHFLSIKWNSDGFTEVFIADAMNLFPEQLENQKFTDNLQISDVHYKNGSPQLVLTVKDLINGNAVSRSVNQEMVSFIPEKQKVNRTEIRRLFAEYSVELKEEKSRLSEFVFFCPEAVEIKNVNFFEAVNRFCKEWDTGISKLNLESVENKNGQNGFSGEIAFDERLSYSEGINLENFAVRSELIIEKKKKQAEGKNENKKQTDYQNTGSNQAKKQDEMLVGEISKKDGTKIQFFKNREGKIEKKELKIEVL